MNPPSDIAAAQQVVMIVDDDPAIRNSLTFSLQTEGIVAFVYANGADLLAAPVADADCFIIDYKLPGMNGLDVLAELRHRGFLAPAILITTHPSAMVRERAAAIGMAIIEKPLLGDALSLEIRTALGAQRRNRLTRDPLPVTES